MKKIIYLILSICFMLSSESFAKSCNGGQIIHGKINEYCVSDIQMNWWTAFVWCQKNGRELVDINQVCDTDTDVWDGSMRCKNLDNNKSINRHCWTSVPYLSGGTYLIYLTDQSVRQNLYRTEPYYALCL